MTMERRSFKKLLALLVAFFSLLTLALTAGCGNSSLEGKWIGIPNGNPGLPIVPTLAITKVKDTDNKYKVTVAAEMYDTHDFGKTFEWMQETNHPVHDAVYDKEKKVLHISVPDLFVKTKSWEMTEKDGKWIMNDLGFGCTYTMEPYDKGLPTAQKALKDWMKKSGGVPENVKFVDLQKK